MLNNLDTSLIKAINQLSVEQRKELQHYLNALEAPSSYDTSAILTDDEFDMLLGRTHEEHKDQPQRHTTCHHLSDHSKRHP